MPRNRTKDNKMPEKLPFQSRHETHVPWPIKERSIEAAVKALPIFGGTSPDPESSSKSESDPVSSGSTSEKTPDSAGGDSAKPETFTPEQIADLVKQVSTLSETSKNLEKELGGYKAKEEETRKAALGREAALEEDLNKANQTIAAMDEVIKYVALVNAIQGETDIQFHDINFVMSKLDENGYDFEVDLESKKANVKGISNELKRIAKENEWAVKNTASNQQQSRQTPARRGSGAPPANPTVDPVKGNRRAELESKWPVITHGFRKTSVS